MPTEERTPETAPGADAAKTKTRIAVLPQLDDHTREAVRNAGGSTVRLEEAQALVWNTSNMDGFPAELPDAVRWVQLPSAGVEKWVDAGVIDGKRQWTSAAGAYALPVAEHAMMLLLAGIRRFPDMVGATTWKKEQLWSQVGTLAGSTVAIIGCGSIGRALIPMLSAMGASVVAVNRSGRAVDGAERTIAADDAVSVWSQADHFIIAAPATDATRHLVGAEQFAGMRPHSWVVNVARGGLIDDDALLEALEAGQLAGAALDVTDPEPLPEGHPFWEHPHVIITPHVANPLAALKENLRLRVAENLSRFAYNEPLLGAVDIQRGY